MSHSLLTGIEQFYHSHLFQHHSLADTHLWPYKGEKKNKQKSGKYIQKGIFSRATTPSDYIVKPSLQYTSGHKKLSDKREIKVHHAEAQDARSNNFPVEGSLWALSIKTGWPSSLSHFSAVKPSAICLTFGKLSVSLCVFVSFTFPGFIYLNYLPRQSSGFWKHFQWNIWKNYLFLADITTTDKTLRD